MDDQLEVNDFSAQTTFRLACGHFWEVGADSRHGQAGMRPITELRTYLS
jgi:hypothetical protein